MSDTAPKRIWLQLGAGDEGTHTWADHQVGWDDDGEYEPEYIRADVAEAHKQLAVAAALREAAEKAMAEFLPEPLGGLYEMDLWQGEMTEAAILALIPDAGAALDRALAAERERCAKVADHWATEGKKAEEEAIKHANAHGALRCAWQADIAEAIAAAIRHGSAISARGGKT